MAEDLEELQPGRVGQSREQCCLFFNLIHNAVPNYKSILMNLSRFILLVTRGVVKFRLKNLDWKYLGAGSAGDGTESRV